ncbi:MAG: hypothetical protein M3024_03540 [Candidatus Dormibacteraeota bacterium]|nr:hypothetical protein [Candidatus Dormibacteraeota bacterium]
MAKGRNKQGREDKKRNKKPKKDLSAAMAPVSFQHHSLTPPAPSKAPTPPIEKTE